MGVYIDRLSGYIASTGKKYRNHAATIRQMGGRRYTKGVEAGAYPITPTRRDRVYDE